MGSEMNRSHDHRLALSPLAGLLMLVGVSQAPGAVEPPAFGRDTVLVWAISNAEEGSRFIVRIADFLPSRYVEWENATLQGTIFMSSQAVQNARTFVNARMFEGGVDTKGGKDATTLWLSQWAFRELKTKSRVKLALDSVEGVMTVEGRDEITVEVNRAPVVLAALRVKDDRGQDRWFLDSEENPLLLKHVFRSFTQTLKSITTDRSNTLRWIKGKKLNQPR